MRHAQLLTRTVRSRHTLFGTLLAACFGASAQTADPVAPFLGTWSGVFTTQENEYWTFADIQCFVGCTKDFYDHLSRLLADPANDATPAFALSAQSNAASLAALDAMLTPMGKQVRAANKPENDPKFLNCQPYGFVREVTNPLPMQISRDGAHLLLRYEEWSLLRPIYMDGRAQPTLSTPSLLGHSVGRVENGALGHWALDLQRHLAVDARERAQVRGKFDANRDSPSLVNGLHRIPSRWAAELKQRRRR